jgi:hypothetical protein
VQRRASAELQAGCDVDEVELLVLAVNYQRRVWHQLQHGWIAALPRPARSESSGVCGARTAVRREHAGEATWACQVRCLELRTILSNQLGIVSFHGLADSFAGRCIHVRTSWAYCHRGEYSSHANMEQKRNQTKMPCMCERENFAPCR